MPIGKFDYVVGNRRDKLGELTRILQRIYKTALELLRAAAKRQWDRVRKSQSRYLYSFCGKMLRSLFWNPAGQLGFLIPFTILKTQGGAGFRNYLASACQVNKIHDLVELYPFEGAINRTALITMAKGQTTFPISSTMWSNPRGGGIDTESELEDVIKETTQHPMIFAPVRREKPDSSWMIISEKAYSAIQNAAGQSPYRAYTGTYTALNGVYWISALSKGAYGVLIENQAGIGRKKVRKLKEVVEEDLIYPLIRGRNIKKWFSTTEDRNYIIIPHDSETGKPLGESMFKMSHPNSYSFLSSFRPILEQRAIHKLWGKKNPFYSIYDIGDYTFKPYKVAWKEIAGKISGKGEFSACVLQSEDDPKFRSEVLDS